MTDPMPVLVTLQVSPVRRIAGVAVTAGLGLLLLSIVALRTPTEPWAIVVLLAAGFAALWQARAMQRARGVVVELTEMELRTSQGELLTTIDGIERIERGLFAFKPSNGFVLVLKERRPRRWVPGLWWQVGRKLGMGGTAHGQQAKNMADTIQAILMNRDGLI